jgi:hypothetical protein
LARLFQKRGSTPPRTRFIRTRNFRFSVGAIFAESFCGVATFVVNSEPHTGPRPSVRFCVELIKGCHSTAVLLTASRVHHQMKILENSAACNLASSAVSRCFDHRRPSPPWVPLRIAFRKKCWKCPWGLVAQAAEACTAVGLGEGPKGLAYEHSEKSRASHTNGPRDVARCGALSLLKKTLHYRGGDLSVQAIVRNGARCTSQLLRRCAKAVSRGAARCALHVHGRGARTDACGRSFVVLSTQFSTAFLRLQLVVPRPMLAAVASRCCRRRF